MKLKFILFFLFFFANTIIALIKKNSARNNAQLMNSYSLNLLLENIDKLKRNQDGFLPQDQSRTFTLDKISENPFSSEKLCVYSLLDGCEKICSDKELCVRCLKSGLGYKCSVH